MKKITWDEMISLKDQNMGPFEVVFNLLDAVDEAGDIAFTTSTVIGWQGEFPIVSFRDGCGTHETFTAVDCDTLYCKIV